MRAGPQFRAPIPEQEKWGRPLVPEETTDCASHKNFLPLVECHLFHLKYGVWSMIIILTIEKGAKVISKKQGRRLIETILPWKAHQPKKEKRQYRCRTSRGR